ncbi:MAG: DivIVA domain-containing protein [Acidimicrobiales bacterium]|nr:DivIVA domain-containing protein [Acidimicrobiales bacterium]
MELTPELLLEAKFGPARRGYDMAEVDDFLERCAEGLDVLLARLKSEFERAEAAEARLAEVTSDAPASADATLIETPEPAVEAQVTPEPAAASVEPPSVDEPMRILVAAERTAEAAVADARAEAERIRTEAESVASQQRSEAETMLATAKAEAEDEARKAGEETKRTIQAEVLALRRDRDGLSDDVRSLRRWLDEQRSRMRSTARELQRIVEDPAALQELAVPDLSEPTSAADDPAAATAPDVGPMGDESDSAGPLVDGPVGEDPGEPTQAVPAVGDADPWADPTT